MFFPWRMIFISTKIKYHLVGFKEKFMSLKKYKDIAMWCINKQNLAQISLIYDLVP